MVQGARTYHFVDISPILPPFESLGAVSYTHFIVTMAVSLTVYDIFSVKEERDFENGLGVVQGH